MDLVFTALIREWGILTNGINLHLDDPTNSQAQQFLAALNSANLTQYVYFPTHWDNHTLDLVITANTSSLSPVIDPHMISR